MKTEKKGNSTTRWLILLLIAAAGVAAMLLADNYHRAQMREESAEELAEAAKDAGYFVTDAVQERVTVVEHLRAFMLARPELPDGPVFDHYAAALLLNAPTIRALQYVDENRVIRQIYPLEGNEEALGLDLATRPAAPFVEEAITEREITINDPTVTVQGSLSIVARAPLYRSGEFVGLAQGVFDINAILEDALANFQDFQVQIWDANGDRFWGPERLAGTTDSATLPVGNRVWTMTMGWRNPPPTAINIALAVIWGGGSAFLLIVLLLVNQTWTRTEWLSQAVAEKTAALRRSEERYRMLFQHASDGITIADAEGNYLEVNANASRMLGYTQEEMQRRNIRDVVAPADLSATPLSLEELQTGGPVISRRILRRKDGTHLPVEVAASALPDGRLLGIIRDITERLETEEALRRKDAILEAVSFSAEQFLVAGRWEARIQAVLARLGKATGVDRVYIFAEHSGTDGQSLVSQRHEWVAPDVEPEIDNPQLQNLSWVETGFGRWYTLLSQGQAVYGPVREFPESEHTLLSAQGILSLVVVPILVAGKLWGFIGFDETKTEREWTDAEVGALETAASTMGAAIRRERAQQVLEQRAAQLALLNDIGSRIASVLELDRLLERTARLVQESFGYHHVALFLLDGEGNELVMKAVAGEFIHLFPAGHRLQLDEGMVGWVAGHGQKLLISDVRTDDRYVNRTPETTPTLSELSVPLRLRDEIVGVLDAQSPRLDGFDENDVMVMETLADQVVAAIENARLYEAVQEELEQRRRAEAELRVSEERFAKAFRASPVAMSLTSMASGRFLDVNDSFLALFGYERGEVVGHTSVQLGIWPSGEARQNVSEQIETQGYAHNFEGQTRDSTGRVREVLVSFEPIEINEEACILSLIHDVTARRQRERELEAIAAMATALRTAQTRAETVPVVLDQLMALMEAAGATLSLLDPASGELEIQLGVGDVADLTGERLRPGEGVSWHVLESGTPYVRDNWADDEAYFFSDRPGHGQAIVSVPLIADEEAIGLLWLDRDQPFSDADVRVLSAVADIAASAIRRAALHERTREQAHRVQRIIDTIPEGVILLDSERRIALANPAGREHLAVLADVSLGDQLTTLGGDPLTRFLAPVPDGTPGREVILPDPERTFDVAARPVAAGEGWVLVLRDVTEARKQEAYLQAQERLATVGQLAAGIAHDFNNIMAIITLYSQSLERDPDLPKRKHYLATISEQAKHAANLIGQILDFSRRAVMERGRLDLLPFVKEVVKLLRRTLPENISISFTHDDGACIVNADPTRLQQVLMNLSVNARDAMPEGGDLRLSLSRLHVEPEQRPPLPEMAPGEWARLTVADTGAGIHPEQLHHIFEPFFTTKSPSQGTGLGLAQVYGIIKQHGGEIDVESELEVGTTFTIYLPAVVQQPPAPEEEGGDLVLTADGQETILVVEDDQTTRTAIRETLEEVLGYRVLAAGTGREALIHFAQRKDQIDLVLSDMVMPEMGGVDLYQALVAMQPEVKMIIMTGYPLNDEGKELLEQGIISWILKPFSPEAIARKIRDVLDTEEKE